LSQADQVLALKISWGRLELLLVRPIRTRSSEHGDKIGMVSFGDRRL
jgi:hypothetical protein